MAFETVPQGRRHNPLSLTLSWRSVHAPLDLTPASALAIAVPPENGPQGCRGARPDGGGGGTFDTAAALEFNAAPRARLASLDLAIDGRTVLEVSAGVARLTDFLLNRGCSIVVTEARRENVDARATYSSCSTSGCRITRRPTHRRSRSPVAEG